MLTRMARMLTHLLTRMTRWLAYYTHSEREPDQDLNLGHDGNR